MGEGELAVGFYWGGCGWGGEGGVGTGGVWEGEVEDAVGCY